MLQRLTIRRLGNSSVSAALFFNVVSLTCLLNHIPASAAFLSAINTNLSLRSTASKSNILKRQAIVDPNLNDIIQSASSVTAGMSSISHGHDPTSLSKILTTMYTATLPPLDPDASNSISTVKDYFIPTTSNDATVKALEGFVQSKQAMNGAPLPNSSDLMKFDQVMPGAKGIANPSLQQQQYVYNEKIDKRELEWIAQQFDIYMRKIPFTVTLYALLDFFVLSPGNNPDVLSDELEEDRMGVVMDWVSSATMRVGILASIVVSIIFIENLTYHPI